MGLFLCCPHKLGQFKVGAGYYFITVMQGRKYMLGPNAAFDRIGGTKPGEACSNRDLIMELALALEKYDIDLYLYFTGDGPYKDEEVGRRFGFVEPRKNISMEFVQNWAEVLKEYAVRYGSHVKGWWIDGCYGEQFGYTQELLQLYHDAIKAGNPDAVSAFNNGVKPTLEKWFHGEEFTAGEYIDFTVLPESRFIDGAQAHTLIPLGVDPTGNLWGGWCETGMRRSAEHIIDYVKKFNAAGGVVTLDVKIWGDGSFDPEQVAFLKQLGQAVPTK